MISHTRSGEQQFDVNTISLASTYGADAQWILNTEMGAYSDVTSLIILFPNRSRDFSYFYALHEKQQSS